MVELIAERGIHGTSMSQVAERAGVATGTAYVHYESKEELLVAAFVEVKRQIGETALAEIDLTAGARDVFDAVWRNVHGHLVSDPSLARFLVQVEVSPLKGHAHDALLEDDPLTQAAQALTTHLVDLPLNLLYDLCLAPAVRLVASGLELSDAETDTLVESCWRSVART